MAKKQGVPAPEEKKAAAAYYKLNLRAVEDLVTANEENSPVISKEELRKYQSGPKIKLEDWVKAALIKIWFAGAVCFFFLWGLGNYLHDQLDQLVVLALAYGFVTDLLTNNVFRFFEKTPGANSRFMMFPRKGYLSLPANVAYAFLVMFCVVMTYNAVNAAVMAFTGVTDQLPLGVEPILFGVFTTLWDTLLIQMKRTLAKIIAEAKQAAARR